MTAITVRMAVMLFCDPAAIRTQDLLLRRQLLYPAELRGHKETKKANFR